MRWTDCRIVAFDTETTGLGPFDGDRIIEFGAVEIEVGGDGRVVGVTPHQMLIDPEIPIPRGATRISGISDEDVAGKPVFAKVADRIRDLLGDAILVAHNISFDINFIRAELSRCGRHWPITRAEVDTLLLSQKLLPGMKSHKLELVAQELSVRLETAHRASDDAEACGRVMVELARRHDAPSDLDAFVDWSDAVGPPPDTGHLALGTKGVAEFRFGEHMGQTIERHPDHLQWMTMALERRDGRWQHRFPDSVRHWIRRWLRVRAAGHVRGAGRSQGSQDWSLDPPPWDLERRG